MSLLQAQSLSFSYGARRVLDGVSISIEAGELVALLGPNGSGKSTLIKSLTGFLRAEGDIEWEGRLLDDWPRADLARRVAYLPQSPSHAPSDRVVDVLRLGRSPYWGAFGIESARDETVVRQVAQDLDLVDLLDRRIADLSGGQRQLVFVGRCLVQQPAALLLDEPSTFLDLKHQVELLGLLKKFAREKGLGVLMASHDLNLTAAYADRLIVLHQGKIAAQGSADHVLTPALLTPVYGVPLTRITHDGGVFVVPAAPV